MQACACIHANKITLTPTGLQRYHQFITNSPQTHRDVLAQTVGLLCKIVSNSPHTHRKLTANSPQTHRKLTANSPHRLRKLSAPPSLHVIPLSPRPGGVQNQFGLAAGVLPAHEAGREKARR
eukprot:8353556-Pyramimonas_sp.AAC.1